MLGCAMRGSGWLEVAVRTTFAGTSFISSQRPRSHGPDRIFRLHTGSTAEICSNIDPKMKMYSHKSMKPHAILRIETILIDLTFIKLKTRIIT